MRAVGAGRGGRVLSPCLSLVLAKASIDAGCGGRVPDGMQQVLCYVRLVVWRAV